MYELLELANELTLPDHEIEFIDEYLGYNEWGIAFEALCKQSKEWRFVARQSSTNESKCWGRKLRWRMSCGLLL